ncbi:hypothetical protein SD951_02610 [Lactobacillus paragasseri]|uniref:hypothetical protein n=1 Tax=Lactobacillus paragasseri TaxID=2107999 RepID=UPI0029C5BAE4|nr:hypothetical protein [Lactobacillus paragasseri]MDX5068467.1 hypothetical protein [Lactobacillus paragasseri]
MKIKYITLYEFIIYIIMFLNLGFLNLFGSFEYTSMLISTVLAISVFFLYVFQPLKNKIPSSWFQIYIILVIIIFFFHIFRLKKINISSMSLLSVINNYEGIFLLLLTFPIYEVLQSNDTKVFFRNLAILGYLALFIRFIVWGMYNFTGGNPAPYLLHGLDWRRSILGHDFIRIAGTFLDIYTFLYSLKNFFYGVRHHGHKVMPFLGTLFLFLYSIFVSQYRMVSLAFFMVFFLLLFKEIYKSNNRVISVLLFVVLVGIGLIITRNLITDFISSFSTTAINGSSTSTRLKGLPFLEAEWKNINIWTGIGFTNDNMEYMNMTYWLSDYGFLANLFQFGIIGMVVYLIPFINGCCQSIFFFFKEKGFYVIGFTIYLLVTSTTFNPMRNQYITILPLYIAFMLNLSESYREKNE